MTSAEGALRIRVLGDGGAGTRELDMPPDGDGAYRIRLRAVAGADWLHIAVFEGSESRLRCELETDGGEIVELRLDSDGGHGWRLDTGGRRTLVLPPKHPDPPLPIADPSTTSPGPGDDSAQGWQVALVLDGTLRRFQRDRAAGWQAGALLGDAVAWPPVAERLAGLVAALAAGDPLPRWSMLAFADHPIPGVVAAGLKPLYDLKLPHTDGRPRLRPYAPDVFRSALDRLGRSPSPGGDFVDALADALAACRRIDWRPGRKVVVVAGDSPGYSILHPVESGGNARARCLDVDTEAMALHAMGVEIVTLYQPPPPEVLAAVEPRARRLAEDAERQYLRLASVPEYADRLDRFDPDAMAGRLRSRDFPIGRGACLGLPVQSES